jgi:phosphatidylinositol alpha-mannosyltransferase
VIVLSADQARFVAERYRVPREWVIVIPNGVPPGLAGEARAGHEEGAPLRVLFVGRLSPQKNLPRLVRALHRMEQPAELAIVGEGPDRASLARLIGRLGLENVRLPGRAERSELHAWYRWADVFVLSSDKEGMPLAALEAMSFGLPFVATDVPGLRELCATAGMLVPPDWVALARALDSLAADPGARQALAERSLAAAGAASWDRPVEQIRELYRELAR